MQLNSIEVILNTYNYNYVLITSYHVISKTRE